MADSYSSGIPTHDDSGDSDYDDSDDSDDDDWIEPNFLHDCVVCERWGELNEYLDEHPHPNLDVERLLTERDNKNRTVFERLSSEDIEIEMEDQEALFCLLRLCKRMPTVLNLTRNSGQDVHDLYNFMQSRLPESRLVDPETYFDSLSFIKIIQEQLPTQYVEYKKKFSPWRELSWGIIGTLVKKATVKVDTPEGRAVNTISMLGCRELINEVLEYLKPPPPRC